MPSVWITTDLGTQCERRLPDDTTIAALKGKLELITGFDPSTVQLELRTKDNHTVKPLNNDARTLSECGVRDEMIIHVSSAAATRTTGTNGAAKDIYSQFGHVEKYEIDEEKYDKRQDSVRAWKQRNKLGEFDEHRHETAQQKIAESEAAAKRVTVDARCEVRIGGTCKRGTVRFVGPVHFKPGYFVGVQYDEPLGKNDGSVDGKHYFTCPPNYGVFVRPQDVECGDFPELSIDDEMDEI